MKSKISKMLKKNNKFQTSVKVGSDYYKIINTRV